MLTKTAFIIEDNGINRLSLETTLEANDFKIMGSFSNAEEAWEKLKNHTPSIVLIDINLAGEKDGIWLANKVRKELNLPFIYLTAYGDKQTIEKIKKTSPNGYLMKPYNEPTLLTSISIAISSHQNLNNSRNKSLYIKDNYIRIKLETQDILYIKSEGNYLEITLQNKKHLIRNKLSDFKKELSVEDFIQVHRRYIVQINKIDFIGNNFIKINDIEIPLSKTFKENFEKQLNIL